MKIDPNTKVEVINANVEAYTWGTDLGNAWTDCCCGVDYLNGVVEVSKLMSMHAMKLEFYQNNLPTLERDGLIKIINEI